MQLVLVLGCYQCPLILSKEPSETIAISLGIGVVSNSGNSGNPLGLAALSPPSSHVSSFSCVPLTAVLLGKEIKIKKHVLAS